MSDNNIERFTVDGLNVRIEYDTDASSSRQDDNLGTIVCWHRRYNLGDEHTFDTPQDFKESLEYLDAAIVLPLYLYDHSGISISVGGFSDPWDSGQVGYIYVSKATIRKEYSVKRISRQLLERVSGYLKSEVETYDQFLTGQVYGYIVEDANGEHIDSCWGFFGLDYVKTEATAAAACAIKQIRKEYNERLERDATSAGDVPMASMEVRP